MKIWISLARLARYMVWAPALGVWFVMRDSKDDAVEVGMLLVVGVTILGVFIERTRRDVASLRREVHSLRARSEPLGDFSDYWRHQERERDEHDAEELREAASLWGCLVIGVAIVAAILAGLYLLARWAFPGAW